VKILERAPRLELGQLRALDSWPTIRERGRAELVINSAEGDKMAVEVELAWDRTSFGRRPWLKCSRCGTRRRHLYLATGELGCRCCLGINYFVHSLPGSRWKHEVALPCIRAAAATTHQEISDIQ